MMFPPSFPSFPPFCLNLYFAKKSKYSLWQSNKLQSMQIKMKTSRLSYRVLGISHRWMSSPGPSPGTLFSAVIDGHGPLRRFAQVLLALQVLAVALTSPSLQSSQRKWRIPIKKTRKLLGKMGIQRMYHGKIITDFASGHQLHGQLDQYGLVDFNGGFNQQEQDI